MAIIGKCGDRLLTKGPWIKLLRGSISKRLCSKQSIAYPRLVSTSSRRTPSSGRECAWRLTDMNACRTHLLAGLLASAAVAMPALCAQPTGLRLTLTTGGGFSLSAPEGGLRLNLSLPGNVQVIGPMFGAEVPVSPQASMTTIPVLSGRTTLSADWLSLGKGFHTSVGLSWRQSQFPGAEPTLQDSNPRTPIAAPFVSVGWRGVSPGSNGWNFSAQAGAYFTGRGDCRADQYCLKPRDVGLNPDTGAGGIRWNPFISFGATLTY